jgi:hypothetical protein
MRVLDVNCELRWKDGSPTIVMEWRGFQNEEQAKAFGDFMHRLAMSQEVITEIASLTEPKVTQ